jgi:hypothetical protein
MYEPPSWVALRRGLHRTPGISTGMWFAEGDFLDILGSLDAQSALGFGKCISPSVLLVDNTGVRL